MMSSMASNNNHHNANVASTKHKVDDIDLEFNELRKYYAGAVECVKQCESIIADLQEQLASKDCHISSLENKIVKMSLELASAKAFEDEHRSTRRNSSIFLEDDETPCDDRAVIHWKERPPRRCSCSSDGAAVMQKIKRMPFDRRHSWSLTLGFMSLGSELVSETVSDDSLRSSNMDISESSSSSFNLVQFFRKNKEELDDTSSEHKVGSKEQEENEHQNDDTDSGITHHQSVLSNKRQPTSQRRLERMQSKLHSSLEGVVFPKSFEEVISKGCLELHNSLISVDKSVKS